MLIHVTAEHIKNGERQSYFCCPIARALAEKFYDWRVDTTFVQIKQKGDSPWQEFFLPTSAQKFIKNFDNNLEVKPFKFRLHVKEN